MTLRYPAIEFEPSDLSCPRCQSYERELVTAHFDENRYIVPAVDRCANCHCDAHQMSLLNDLAAIVLDDFSADQARELFTEIRRDYGVRVCSRVAAVCAARIHPERGSGRDVRSYFETYFMRLSQA